MTAFKTHRQKEIAEWEGESIGFFWNKNIFEWSVQLGMIRNTDKKMESTTENSACWLYYGKNCAKIALPSALYKHIQGVEKEGEMESACSISTQGNEIWKQQ